MSLKILLSRIALLMSFFIMFVAPTVAQSSGIIRGRRIFRTLTLIAISP
jgi:hypothetical protein